MDKKWDCLVVGGGAAGLSATLVLGRARWRTLLVDAGEQSNLASHGIGGLLGYDGRTPAELYEAGRKELSVYPSVEVRDGIVVRAGGTSDEGFRLELADGGVEVARKIILATGMEYRSDDLPGLKELWGNSVFNCPFCHGWEARDGALGAKGNGGPGVHGALMLRGWSDDVILLTDGPAELDDDQRRRLDQAGVPIEERPVASLRQSDGSLAAVVFADGSELERDGLMIGARLHQRSDLHLQLGAEVSPPGPMMEDALVVDQFQRTSVPGVFAAGDAGGDMPQVAGAVAKGSMAGVLVVQALLSEDFGLPLPPAMTAT